ncbi:MAG: hypothetical protein ACLUDH_13915 [Faecalispora sporosphaeroides]|mgnify:CR=1 FL=1|uniref:hypothetical protein n=1 Tax=Faecalispora sporosphaeroides TaxID=1549 RepID=UPI002051E560|nr:hypothetical protein [Clostridium sp.]DAI95691.1 MAG TPA: hypothetical protein [Caudoviricetes sp.]
MSQQIIFADGTTLDVAKIDGQSTYHQGAQRDSLEIQIAKGTISFDTLDALTADSAKTDRLTIVTTDGEQQAQAVYDHYVIRAALALKSIEIPATADAAATTEDRLCVTLAQLTYAEVQQAAQAAAIDALGQQVVALSLGGAL